MPRFEPILNRAVKSAGGAAKMEKLLLRPATARKLKGVSDDRYLSQMQLRIFQAGLRHSMVEARWPAFEEVFKGFDPRKVHAMNDEKLESLMQDRRLIRHWGKIRSVRDNAAAVIDSANEAGSFGAWVAGWPVTDIAGLWAELSQRFSQLGGMSGPYFLRRIGKDTFILTRDVLAALNTCGAAKGKISGKKDRARVQQVFNAWMDESGRPLCQLSRILALSVG